MASWFDDSRLDDARILERHDTVLRQLAESGARVRRDAAEAEAALREALIAQREAARPRAVLAAGPDARLLRAVLEQTCPVPFVAWPHPALPGWVGGLDLVVVLAPEGSDRGAAAAVAEAVRRGCQLVVVAPERSLVAEHAVGRWVTLLPTVTGDPLGTAVVMLDYLARLALGPTSDAEDVATALDAVATACSPHRDLAVNPAKMSAIALADATPVVWGGSVLAARAARRVAESLRRTTGRSAVAGELGQVLPLIEGAPLRDVFADPFAEDAPSAPPVLLILEDGAEEPWVREDRGRLLAAAQQRGVRVETLRSDRATEVARYADLLLQGTYAAEYLRLGLIEETP